MEENLEIFNSIRMELARGHLHAPWEEVQPKKRSFEPNYKIFQSTIPGLIACRIYLDNKELKKLEEEGRISKSAVSGSFSVSRDITGEDERIHYSLSRTSDGGFSKIYASRILNMYKVTEYKNKELTQEGFAYLRKEITKEDVSDFKKNLPKIIKSFKGNLDIKIAQGFRNLVGCLEREKRFDVENDRRFYPNEEGEFLFLEGALSHYYGY